MSTLRTPRDVASDIEKPFDTTRDGLVIAMTLLFTGDAIYTSAELIWHPVEVPIAMLIGIGLLFGLCVACLMAGNSPESMDLIIFVLRLAMAEMGIVGIMGAIGAWDTSYMYAYGLPGLFLLGVVLPAMYK